MGLLKKNKGSHEKWFNVISECIKFTIKNETTSTAGRINLIGGLVVSLFVFCSCFSSIISKIIGIFVSDFNKPVPFWVIIIFIFFISIYFLICSKYIVNNSKDNKDNKKDNQVQ